MKLLAGNHRFAILGLNSSDDRLFAGGAVMHPYQLLLLEGWVFAFMGPIVLLAQLACLIHVIRTGRPYWWLWVIFGFPLVGLAAYVLLEVRPSWAKGDFHSLMWRLKSPQERIRILEAE